MCYVASSLLATLHVNAFSSTKDIKEILDSIGIKAEERGPAQQSHQWAERKTSSLTRLLASWLTVAFSTPPTPTLTPKSKAPAAGSAPTIAQEKKDEKELEEWDEDMRFGLFN